VWKPDFDNCAANVENVQYLSIMRTLLDIFAQIFRNLWAHKLRSFLTMFGIAWGVGSLLLLVGVGEGFRSGNKRELAEFGKDIMFILSLIHI